MPIPQLRRAVNKIAFPMYNIAPAATAALADAIAGLLAARGMQVQPIWPVGELLRHWQRDDLLLSQTCGFPLMTQLATIQVVGCFHYLAPGCEDFRYRSLLVARTEEAGKTLADFRARRAVCNAIDSHSGYNVLRYMISCLPGEGRFFSQTLFSGSHHQSLQALIEGRADIAAIDCVTFALLQRDAPASLNGLKVIELSPLAPGLPLIAAQRISASALAQVREALQQLVSDRQYRDICRHADWRL